MATEECAICGDSVPFATTTHVLVNPKHVEGVADHYVCRPCYDEHLEGLFAALSADGEVAEPLEVGEDAVAEEDDGVADESDGVADDGDGVGDDRDGDPVEHGGDSASDDVGEDDGERVDASPE